MNRVNKLLELPIPVVFSSATLATHAYHNLLKIMKLDYFSRIPVVQGGVTMQNMSYYVNDLPRDLKNYEYTGFLLQFITRFEQENQGQLPNPRARVIIFCMSKTIIATLFRTLGDHSYLGPAVAQFHADLPEPERVAELDRFQSGKARVLLATSAIGAGFDFDHVDAVIHLESAYGLTDFMQESGRTGRDPGRSGWSFCLIKSSERNPRSSDSTDRLEFRKYLNEQICRRRVILLNFGEIPRSCDPSWQLCDLCLRQKTQQDLVRQAVKQSYQEATAEIEFLARATEFFTDSVCLICFTKWISKYIPILLYILY